MPNISKMNITEYVDENTFQPIIKFHNGTCISKEFLMDISAFVGEEKLQHVLECINKDDRTFDLYYIKIGNGYHLNCIPRNSIGVL